MDRDRFFGCVEAGGTKMVVAIFSVADNDHPLLEKTSTFPTTTPSENFSQIREFFEAWDRDIDSFGIATFGPVDLNRDSDTFGHILKTPKPHWQGANWRDAIPVSALDQPFAIDTDVNAAALGEQRWGAAEDVDNLVYITIGTGIGAGIIHDGHPIHGMVHPEVGHIFIPREPEEKAEFSGVCPFHGDCLEGLASGPAIQARWNQPAEQLPDDHPAWEEESSHLAWACINLITTVSPQRIIIGGGVSQNENLFPLIRDKVQTRLNGYVDRPELTTQINSFIQPPQLGQQAGIYGALALATPRQ